MTMEFIKQNKIVANTLSLYYNNDSTILIDGSTFEAFKKI